MEPSSRREFQRRAEHVDALLERVEALSDGPGRDLCLDAIQAVLDLHGEALRHLLGVVGPEAAQRLGEDEVVRGLLLLHGLHPRTLAERVEDALDSVRPYLASHGGGVEVVGLDSDGLHLRLQGSCDGCAASEATLRGMLERALGERAPDLPSLQVDGVVPPDAGTAPPVFVPVGAIGRRPSPRAMAR